MPLIVITGLPCSGKSHRARQIFEDFQTRLASQTSDSNKRSVVICPSRHAYLDPSLEADEIYSPPPQDSNPRDQIYNLASTEKIARAEEFSAIKRAVSKHAIVIADAPNYIKGFRYQLWCEAKAAGTRCVVVHTAAREDECKAWNTARLQVWSWDAKEDEEIAEEEERTKKMGPKIGKDVLGDLTPESHTALYGDKILGSTKPRSRSSSTGAAVSDSGSEDEDQAARVKHLPADDTMTLKSLYITNSSPNQLSTSIPEKVSRSISGSQTPNISAPAAPPPPNSSLPYTLKTLSSLLMRYEPPSPFTRWDTPLFTVPSSDAHPPYSAIWDAVFPTQSSKPLSKKVLAQQTRAEREAGGSDTGEDIVKQHAATILPSATGANALQMLEHTTGDCVKAILAAARSSNDGSGVALAFSVATGGSEERNVQATLEVPPGVVLSQPMLQRLRRKYTQIQRGGIAHGQGYVKGQQEIVEGFVRFLSQEWESD